MPKDLTFWSPALETRGWTASSVLPARKTSMCWIAAYLAESSLCSTRHEQAAASWPRRMDGAEPAGLGRPAFSHARARPR